MVYSDSLCTMILYYYCLINILSVGYLKDPLVYEPYGLF
jgi:hypothetical protein